MSDYKEISDQTIQELGKQLAISVNVLMETYMEDGYDPYEIRKLIVVLMHRAILYFLEDAQAEMN